MRDALQLRNVSVRAAPASQRASRELAHRDWMTTAGFDRAEDLWPRRWAEAYLDFAAGEVAGFGGGGMHGYRSLEGAFLGGCLFGGRVAGRAV